MGTPPDPSGPGRQIQSNRRQWHRLRLCPPIALAPSANAPVSPLLAAQRGLLSMVPDKSRPARCTAAMFTLMQPRPSLCWVADTPRLAEVLNR